MVRVWSWHCDHNFFMKAPFGNLPPIKRNVTHFRLPVCMEFEPTALVTDPEEALGQAFDFFNWAHVEFCAPEEVNDNARTYNTHASQSVGDVVEIEGEGGGWWMVEGIGWRKLTENDLYGERV